MTVGERLRIWRKEKGITSIDIRDKTGIPTSLISDYENDKKAIGSKNLISLYETYDIDIVWILTGNKNENALSDNEYQIIQYYRLCDTKTKEQIMNFILFCLANQNNAASEDKGKSFTSKIG